MRSGPVDRYLRELEGRLPYPGRRILRETRDHLVDERERLVAEGISSEEAEERAVAAYGPVEDMLDAIRREGTPLLSPRDMRWIVGLAIFLSLPTFVFLGINLIEMLAGNSGGIPIYGGQLERWRGLIDLILVGGPFVAFALVLLATVRVRFERVMGATQATIRLRLTKGLVVAGVISGLMATAVGLYGLAENILCLAEDCGWG